MLKREISFFFPAHSVIWTAQISNDHQVDSGIFVHCWRIVLCLKTVGHWLPGHVHLFWVWYVQMLYAVHRVTCDVVMCLCLRVAVEFDPIYWLHQSLKYLLNINCLLFFLVHQSGKNWQVPGLFFLLLSFQILVFWHATSIFLLTCKDSCIYSHLGLSNTGIWCLGPKIYSEMNFFWALQLLSSSSIILFKLFCYVWVGDVTVFNIVEYNFPEELYRCHH